MNERELVHKKSLDLINQSLKQNPKRHVAATIGMGVGKTKIFIDFLISRYHESATFLILIPKKTVVQSWTSELVKFNAAWLIPHLHFCLYKNYNIEIGKTEDGLLLKDCVFDYTLMDECHNLKKDYHYITLVRLQNPCVALTGTMFPNETYDYGRFIQYFEIVYTYTVRDSVKNSVINDYRIIIHKIPASKTIRIDTYCFGYLTEHQGLIQYEIAIKKALANKKFASVQQLRLMRMKMIQNSKSKLLYAKELMKIIPNKTIVYAESHSHAEQICKHQYNAKVSKAVREKNLIDFIQGDILKLSAVQMLNESINIPNLESVVIIHNYANNVTSGQRIARGFRLGADSGKTMYAHLLMFENSIDEEWCKKSLLDFDNTKIGYYSENNRQILLKKANLL